jgi:hypothetical protein
LLIDFQQRAEAVGKPGLYPGLLGLLGGMHADLEALQAWLSPWQAAIEALPIGGSAPARLHPHRIPYYLKAFTAVLASPQPRNVLWPLLRTWTHTIQALDVENPAREQWRQAGEYLGLLGSSFSERVAALDAYLDMVEETLESWARLNGA